MFGFKPKSLPTAAEALPGRSEPIASGDTHFVSGRSMHPPFPAHLSQAVLGLGCFWGAERIFWQRPGVWVTAVGYAAGHTVHPTYREVCSGRTGHTEAVLVVFEPKLISYAEVLQAFWQSHDPTQGMRQGNDVGTQYRSLIMAFDAEQLRQAKASRDAYGAVLAKRGFPGITTEIVEAAPFYYAEEYHQQYLAKNPGGYCGLGGTGVACPVLVTE